MMGILQLEDQPPIVQAIFASEPDEIRTLIVCLEDVNTLDCEKRTPLHAAAFMGDPTITSILLSNGARVNAKDSKWITPLHRACSVGAAETVSLLLKHQADVSARDRLWQTPLHVAAANDADNCIEKLLSFIPNINVTDRSGRTALHHAAYNGHVITADLLIANGCIVNACDKKDCRPLHYAVQMGHVDIIELLIKHGADVNAKDRNQYTPLHAAAVAVSELDNIYRILLSAGADINAQNSYGNTPLHIACLNGNLIACHELVVGGADVEVTNFRGQTPLHIAAASTNGVDCLDYLISQNANINVQSFDGRTPLHMTAIHGRFTRSKTLIDRGALVDSADKNGSTALHIAAQYGHDLLANTLLSFGANPLKRGYEGRTPLHMCCLSGYVECCRKILHAGVNINAVDDSGKTAIHCAAYKGSIECLDLLVSNGGDFEITDNLQRLPIHYAASQGHYQCVFTLVGIRSPINATDGEGCTPLHLAAGYDLEGKCVEYLLEHRADPKIKDKRGFSALHYAIAGGNATGVIKLLSVSENVFDKDSVIPTPLHLAAKLGSLPILRAVLSHYVDVNIQTEEGYTPLILAAREGHTQCINYLMRFGAKVAISDKLNNMNPIHYSAKNGHSQCLSLLLHNSEDQNVVNMLDSQHRTALMLAVSGNHIECVQTLLKCGADPNIVDTDNHTCLFRAVVNGQNSVVQLLLSSEAKVQNVDVNGKNVLHLAAACGHFVCLQMILDSMTEDDAQAKDNQQCTVLHWACYNGHANCVECLLEKKIFKDLDGNQFSPVHCATFSGSEKCLELLVSHFGKQIIHLKDCRQRTPLHIAALHGHTDCAKYLIDQGAEVQVFDEEGRTPLIAGAQYGQCQVVELLLNSNAERTSCDKLGNSALHWACLKRHSQTALWILEGVQDSSVINLANSEKRTPLHLAARNGLVDVTRELIRKGASVLAVDGDGLTPALCCAPNNNVAQCLSLILQALPEFVMKNMPENDDPLCLLKFYENILLDKLNFIQHSLKSMSSQTNLSLVANSDLLEVKRLMNKKMKKSKYAMKFLDLEKDNHDCFVVENTDFDVEQPLDDNKEKTGLFLHKSASDISIVGGWKCRDVDVIGAAVRIFDKRKNCQMCLRLQRRCPSCLRHILKQQLYKNTYGKLLQRDSKHVFIFGTRKKEINKSVAAAGSSNKVQLVCTAVSKKLINRKIDNVGSDRNKSDEDKKSIWDCIPQYLNYKQANETDFELLKLISNEFAQQFLNNCASSSSDFDKSISVFNRIRKDKNYNLDQSVVQTLTNVFRIVLQQQSLPPQLVEIAEKKIGTTDDRNCSISVIGHLDDYPASLTNSDIDIAKSISHISHNSKPDIKSDNSNHSSDNEFF